MRILKIVKESEVLKKKIKEYKLKKKTIGFVPTLGGLHKGHLQLIKLAKKKTDIVVVSIFLNPLQFNSKQDLKRYPVNLTTDKKKIAKEKINILYLPTVKEIFPNKRIKKIKASNKSHILCGKYRNGHFDGVVTVLKELFSQVRPNLVFLGEKDFQQVQVIKDLISKYKMRIKVTTLSTIRDRNGLAYSSRNKLLDKKQRKIASFLFKTIKEISVKATKDPKRLKDLIKSGKAKLIKYGFNKVDYLEIYNQNNLKQPNALKERNMRIFVAAYIGKIRLIDNCIIN